jgi:hypothetical protein
MHAALNATLTRAIQGFLLALLYALYIYIYIRMNLPYIQLRSPCLAVQ